MSVPISQFISPSPLHSDNHKFITCMQIKKQQLEPYMEQLTWFKFEEGVPQGCILSPCLFNLHAEHIMWNAGLDELQAEIKIYVTNINSLRYADVTILMAESKEELNNFLMRVKEESEKASFKLNIMSDMRTITPVFFCFPFSWNIFFHSLTFSLYVSLGLKWVFCRQHVMDLVFVSIQLVCVFWLEHLIYLHLK